MVLRKICISRSFLVILCPYFDERNVERCKEAFVMVHFLFFRPKLTQNLEKSFGDTRKE